MKTKSQRGLPKCHPATKKQSWESHCKIPVHDTAPDCLPKHRKENGERQSRNKGEMSRCSGCKTRRCSLLVPTLYLEDCGSECFKFCILGDSLSYPSPCTEKRHCLIRVCFLCSPCTEGWEVWMKSGLEGNRSWRLQASCPVALRPLSSGRLCGLRMPQQASSTF